ncbi:MAG: hypothetical protein M1333_01205 [Patescibacteria group bacterium]|nr:hypothetical protein [Patescibacteria group bacterium]
MNQVFTKKNLPLLVALAIPLLMILGVAAAVYLPGLGKKPTYNFLYLSGSGVTYPGYADYYFSVENGKLIKQAMPPDSSLSIYYKNQARDQRLFVYDAESDTSKEVGFEEAQKYTLDSANQSPDGYQVSRGTYSGGFLFFDGRSDYEHWYLRGHNRSRQLNLKLVGANTYDNFRFLGWIKQ